MRFIQISKFVLETEKDYFKVFFNLIISHNENFKYKGN